MKLKKKLKRALQEFFGTNVRDIPFPQDFDGKDWSTLINAMREAKPSQRLAYYKDFRMFLKEIKFETVYESNADKPGSHSND